VRENGAVVTRRLGDDAPDATLGADGWAVLGWPTAAAVKVSAPGHPEHVGHTVAADLWSERCCRLKHRMDYRPIYHTQPYRRPL
jgi:hypothetical protein